MSLWTWSPGLLPCISCRRSEPSSRPPHLRPFRRHRSRPRWPCPPPAGLPRRRRHRLGMVLLSGWSPSPFLLSAVAASALFFLPLALTALLERGGGVTDICSNPLATRLRNHVKKVVSPTYALTTDEAREWTTRRNRG